MTLTRQHVLDTVAIYIRAWTTRDPDLIVTIFTDTATYHERVLQEPIRDRKGIYEYWQSKVVGSQDHIACKLLNTYVDGDTAIVEWEAEFDDLEKGDRVRMCEIAVLVFEGERIASLREYWASKRVAGLAVVG